MEAIPNEFNTCKGMCGIQKQICKMLDEWYGTGEEIIPYAIRRLDYHDFDNYCASIEVKDTSEGLVPDSTFFCLDVD